MFCVTYVLCLFSIVYYIYLGLESSILKRTSTKTKIVIIYIKSYHFIIKRKHIGEHLAPSQAKATVVQVKIRQQVEDIWEKKGFTSNICKKKSRKPWQFCDEVTFSGCCLLLRDPKSRRPFFKWPPNRGPYLKVRAWITWDPDLVKRCLHQFLVLVSPAWLRFPIAWLPLAWHAGGTCG